MSKEETSKITIVYDVNKYNEEYEDINIFGEEFVKNNKNICKMIINDKDYKISEKYDITNYNSNKLEIKLTKINKIINTSYMFRGCLSLSSLPDISKWNTNNVIDMSCMFEGCPSLSSLPDFQNGILIMLSIRVICLIDVYHYHHYLIFQNGILIMLLI